MSLWILASIVYYLPCCILIILIYHRLLFLYSSKGSRLWLNWDSYRDSKGRLRIILFVLHTIALETFRSNIKKLVSWKSDINNSTYIINKYVTPLALSTVGSVEYVTWFKALLYPLVNQFVFVCVVSFFLKIWCIERNVCSHIFVIAHNTLFYTNSYMFEIS